MSTEPVYRAADGTEVCLSDMSLMYEGIDLFDNSSDMGAV